MHLTGERKLNTAALYVISQIIQTILICDTWLMNRSSVDTLRHVVYFSGNIFGQIEKKISVTAYYCKDHILYRVINNNDYLVV